MKTMNVAIAAAGLLALAACGGGNQADNQAASTNVVGTTEIGNTAILPATNLGTTNDAGIPSADVNLSFDAAGQAPAANGTANSQRDAARQGQEPS